MLVSENQQPGAPSDSSEEQFIEILKVQLRLINLFISYRKFDKSYVTLECL